MQQVKEKDTEQYYLDTLRLASSRNPKEIYQLIAFKHLHDARMYLLVAGDYEASQLVQSVIDILRPYGLISE